VLHADGSSVDPGNPIVKGEALAIYLIGLGEVNASLDCGAAAPPDTLVTTVVTPEVYLQNMPMTVTFSGLAPEFAGIYQVNALVPTTLPSGRSAMLTLKAGEESSTTLVALP
jgi:uncharacterized protein (TIGR03437 family)